MQLHALEPLLKVFYVFIYKFSFPADKNFPRKISDKYMENLKQASFWTTCLEKFERSYVPPKTHVSKILCCVALAVYKSYFFFRTAVLRKLFDISHFSDHMGPICTLRFILIGKSTMVF